MSFIDQFRELGTKMITVTPGPQRPGRDVGVFEGLVQTSTVSFNVETPVYDGDELEWDDPRGDRRHVWAVEVTPLEGGDTLASLSHLKVTFSEKRPHVPVRVSTAEAKTRQMLVLAAVWELAGDAYKLVEMFEINEHLAGTTVLHGSSVGIELRTLAAAGLAQLMPGLVPDTGGVSLTPEGVETARAFEEERNDPIRRIRAIQDLYLRWIYQETEVRSVIATPDGYFATSPSHLGIPLTKAEVYKANGRLEQGGFIEGPGAWQLEGPLRPKLTRKGIETVEHGRSVHDSDASATAQHFHTTVHGPANVANASAHVTQSMTVINGWQDSVTEVIDAVTQALQAFQPEERDAIEPLLAEAREAAASGVPSKANRALTTLGGFLKDTTTGALGGILATQILAVAAQIFGSTS